MSTFRIPLSPCSASRPRVSRQGWTYYAKPYKEFKAALAAHLKQIGLKYSTGAGPPGLDVTIRCFATQPKSTKLPFPKPDVDNYAKAVMDGLTGHAWEDDWLVQRLTVEKAWAPKGEDGWIEVTVEHKWRIDEQSANVSNCCGAIGELRGEA